MSTETTTSFKKMLPGVCQAITITTVGHPFDTIKTRLQSGMYTGAVDCCTKTISIEGPMAFYRGVASPLFSHLIKRSYQFPLFDWMVNEQNVNRYAAGFMSGATGTIFGNPWQIMKVNMQSSTAYQHKSAFSFGSQHWKQHGIKGFYKGWRITMIKDASFGSMFMGTYDFFRSQLGNDTHTQRFFNGATAHCITWFALFPIDLIKTKVQLHHDEKISGSECVRRVIRSDGIFGLWRGVTPMLLRSIPVSGFGMMAYEFVKEKC
jgi:solute carrier family 25 carnitine/acylcarnitine transporter 20/29